MNIKITFFTILLSTFFLISAAYCDNRSPELWKTYMHGIKPDQATKITVSDIIKLNPACKKFICTQNMLKEEPAFKIKSKSNLTVNLPIDITSVKGKKIRLFYWCKAFKVGYGNGWHAPWLILIARDKNKKILLSSPAWFHTEGTYPWHCYYVDIFIPKVTEEFAIKFYTPNGIAYFSGFAYEEVTKANTYSNNYKQCPVTGSLAPNVYYDQMPEHMTYGYGTKYPYRWLLGSKVGLIGQPDDVTTIAGFTHYFKTKGIKKSEHINHGLLHLANAYRSGKKLALLPKMEDGWLENFRDLLLEAQDPATGYWHDGKSLSMGATFHLLNMHFRYYELSRSDRQDILKPGFALTKTVPRADEMIAQTLKQQSSWRDEQGILRKAGWNNDAYTFTITPDKSKSKFAMGSTWDAVYLLRLAGRFATKKETKQQIYNSIKDAYFYFVNKMILPDGNIRLVDTSDKPALGYVSVLLQDFHCFERRIVDDISTSSASITKDGNKLSISAKIADNADAVRIYIAPERIAIKEVDEKYLVGIIHKKGSRYCELDPLAVYHKCNDAAKLRFGREIYTGKGPRDMYLRYKFSKIKMPVPFTTNNESIIINADTAGKKIYISSSNWYGEESLPVEITH